ncbi:MAG: hypothetical protein SGARI_007072, partial [Bacillariaceae sp.]
MTDGASDPTKYSDMILKTYMIPFGSALLLRNDLPHSGTYGSQDNTRLYMGMFPSNIDKRLDVDEVATIAERNFGSNESDGMDPTETLGRSPSIHVSQKFRYANQYVLRYNMFHPHFMRTQLPSFVQDAHMNKKATSSMRTRARGM